MENKKISLKTCLLIVSGILILDQVLKVYIKLNYSLTFYGEQAIIDWGWFKLLFIENRGMAWGAKLNDFLPFIDDKSAKLFLTLFRIVAIGFLFYWLKNIVKENSNKLLAICLSLILAGAIGNVIDSVFYGYLFTESYFEVAKFSLEMVMKVFFMEMLLICFSFHYLHGLGLIGSLFQLVKNLPFLNQFLILLIPQSPLV